MSITIKIPSRVASKRFYLQFRISYRNIGEIYSRFLSNIREFCRIFSSLNSWKRPPEFIPWIRGSVQRATIWVMMRARVTGVDMASHGSEYPCNPRYVGSPTSCPQIRHPWGFLAQIPRLTWRNAHDSKYWFPLGDLTTTRKTVSSIFKFPDQEDNFEKNNFIKFQGNFYVLFVIVEFSWKFDEGFFLSFFLFC